ncbi:BMP family lipoprotein [Prauserella cavernicola]|uniref:BMP family ABC transporter substrate-binding protein n=1 Tax=Prauserella cavernicola TaxID=2800127 RepID=A0A934R1X5_9PSEU|nr:BMP family ABC transporter substrate-binding protein [Prauserella cavernicola]MBK1789323.1 BMP family ABC transporter substrate-binding protein [Prauserella cavernicola]
MRRKRGGALAAIAMAGVLALAGCGASDDGGDSGGASGELKIGLAYDIGGRGDQSFNDSAARGLDKAKDEFSIEATELEASQGETDAQKEDRLRQLAEGGYNPIIAVGFAYAGPLGKVATDFPEVKFAIVDDFTPGTDDGPNIANLTFAEEQGSFLVGVAAALKSKTDSVGFVGGVNTPLIQKFEAGYTAGVKAVTPDATVQVKYLTQPPDYSGFNDPAKGETAANGMLDADADVIYAAAGGSGSGVFRAAKEKGAMGIGVDSDQYNLPSLNDVKDVIITSMVKSVDLAVYDFIKSVDGDSFKAGNTVYDLSDGGVQYATSGGKIEDIKPQLEEYKQKIISGEIEVPSTT